MKGCGVITMFVRGHPEPAGSKKAFPIKRKTGSVGVSVVDANPRSKGWKAQVSAVAQSQYRHDPLRGPIFLQLIFLVSRPKSHYRTGKHAHLLKESAPAAPITRPDVLKLARGVEDALTGIIYVDDSQITSELLVKRYADREGVIVRISDDPAKDADWIDSLLNSVSEN